MTLYADIDLLLDQLLAEIQTVLGDKLLGLYLYGSLVSGDFDHEISDIDLLAVLASDLADHEADGLRLMHEAFCRQNPAWHNRIEVQYFSAEGLGTFRTRSSKMGNISPGEPFHVIDSGIEWLLNWHFVREHDVVLFGPSSHRFIGPISHDEYLAAVRNQAQDLAGHVGEMEHSWPGQSYTILTLCRAMYSVDHGAQPSKKQAAEWVARLSPEWAPVIQNALLWRMHATPEPGSPEIAFPDTERFVQFALGYILGA